MPDTSDTQKSLPTLASELKELVLAYAKQETIVPIKNLGRFIAFGVAGSTVLSVGMLLLALALLRGLQVETGSTFRGNASWAPYLITLVVCVVVIALAARAVGAARRRGARPGRRPGGGPS